MSRLRLALAALLLTACASSVPATLPRASNASPVLPAPSAEPSIDPSPPGLQRTGAPGSTLKTISCGNKRCKVGAEVCTRSGLSDADPLTCLPKSTPHTGQDRYACDDPSDCNAPSTCCMSWATASEDFACRKPDDNCKALPCSAAEDSRCPEGQSCQNGFCGVAVHATCGGGQQCPTAKPFCAWSGSAECVSKSVAFAAEGALDSGGRVTGLYRCTKRSDCGTQLCCTSTGIGVAETFCMHTCDSGGTMTVCDSMADCGQYSSERCGADAACRKRVRCAPLHPEPNGPPPPWMKLCLVDE